jgi:hypothetical protein
MWPQSSPCVDLTQGAALSLRLQVGVTSASRGKGPYKSDLRNHQAIVQPRSDLRNHQAIVQPRSYDSLMVTQITLKTEGPHGLPSGRRTEVDPLYPGLIILTVYDCGHAFQSLVRSEPCANATARELGEGLRNVHKSSAGGFDWDHPTHPTQQLFP